jgi:hypothetical protein
VNATAALPAFGWSEVNCFLRPQYLACEALAPDHGGLFLFLASQHRAHGLRPALPDSHQHGADSHTAFCDLTGIEFRVTSSPSAQDAVSNLKQALDDGPVILPVAPDHLSYLAPAQAGGALHHVTVLAFERNRAAFVVLDNLAFHRDQKSVAYVAVTIAETALDQAIRQARAGHHCQQKQGVGWMLQIRRGPRFVPRSEVAVARVMVTEYRRLTGTHSVQRLLPIEERYLIALQKAARGHSAGVGPLVREYLSDCNFSGVNLRLAAHALERMGGQSNADLQPLVEQTIALARSTRAHSLVNCLSAAMTEQDWALFRTRLVETMSTLQQRLTIAAAELE